MWKRKHQYIQHTNIPTEIISILKTANLQTVFILRILLGILKIGYVSDVYPNLRESSNNDDNNNNHRRIFQGIGIFVLYFYLYW